MFVAAHPSDRMNARETLDWRREREQWFAWVI